jgi:uncharacterized protein (TIGR03437 family)
MVMRRRLYSVISIVLLVAGCLSTGNESLAQSLPLNPPFFTAAGIVQGATQVAQTLAPNTIATIYGTNLSWTTHILVAADLNGGTLPTSLDGVSVYVHNIESNLLYVSPTQINFLIPYELTVASAEVVVARQGIAGPIGPDGLPSVKIQMTTVAPGFFQWNGNFALAQHADGSLIDPGSPAQPGETIVLYAAGLGRTVPDSSSGVVPTAAATILYASQLQIMLNGVALPGASVQYAGVTPGYAGLYQINVVLPAVLPPNPQIQIVMGTEASPPAIQLYAN